MNLNKYYHPDEKTYNWKSRGYITEPAYKFYNTKNLIEALEEATKLIYDTDFSFVYVNPKGWQTIHLIKANKNVPNTIVHKEWNKSVVKIPEHIFKEMVDFLTS